MRIIATSQPQVVTPAQAVKEEWNRNIYKKSDNRSTSTTKFQTSCPTQLRKTAKHDYS